MAWPRDGHVDLKTQVESLTLIVKKLQAEMKEMQYEMSNLKRAIRASGIKQKD